MALTFLHAWMGEESSCLTLPGRLSPYSLTASSSLASLTHVSHDSWKSAYSQGEIIGLSSGSKVETIPARVREQWELLKKFLSLENTI